MPTISAQQPMPQAAAAEPIPQQQAVPEPAKSDAPEKLSPQFAALARKEKAIRLEVQKLKLEREAVKAEQEKYKSKDYVPRERITKETLAVLSEAGLSHDQVANLLLTNPEGQQQDPMVAKLMARIEELEGKTTKVETDFKDQQSKAYDQAVTQIRNDAKILIDSDPAYETIKATGKQESVVEHIKRTFAEDGILLSVEDAAKEVEELLVEEAMKMAGLNKVKQRLQPPPAEPQKPQQVNRQQQPIKTLTHDLSASTTKQSLSAKDRYQRAMLRAQGLDPDTGKPIGAA
jgi:hypothetical protein